MLDPRMIYSCAYWRDAGDLATVAQYPTRSDAEIVRARLLSDGIEAIVIADDEGGLNPGFYARYAVRVVVAAADLSDARESLEIEVVLLPDAVFRAMVDHARVWSPDEACGLVAGVGGAATRLYPLDNAEPSPHRFTLDPADHFSALQHADEDDEGIIGLFHSHPASAPVPSAADLEGGGDPDWLHFILGIEEGRIAVRAYRYLGGSASSVEVERQ